jgi:hypothetical protein
MYDEKIRYDKFFYKNMKLHSISDNNEFMVYLTTKVINGPKKKLKQIRVVINTGLNGKNRECIKNLYERDMTSKLNKLVKRLFFSDPMVLEFITFYIIIIKHSKTVKIDCLGGALFAIRELFGAANKILTCLKFSPVNSNEGLIKLRSNSLNPKYSCWSIMIIMILYEFNIFLISSGGMISVDFLLTYIYYCGNIKWVFNSKNSNYLL